MEIEKHSVMHICIMVILILMQFGCRTGGRNGNETENTNGEGNGHITYRLSEGHIYRIEAQEGAIPEDLSVALDSLSPGSDDAVNISPDGEWLVLITTRFDSECTDWACLAVVKSDLSSGDVVRANGQIIHPEGIAIASGGNMIIYVAGDGTHSRDLWKVTRSGNTWNTPVLLTGASTYDFAGWPAISHDGSKVIFDCGDVPAGDEGTAICEIGVNGNGFRVVRTPDDVPSGYSSSPQLHSPDYAPDGSIVFESDWSGFSTQIWQLPADSGEPYPISTSDFPNQVGPCVLPDGRVVHLWLGRSENTEGFHELTVMEADGSSTTVILQGVNIFDIGIGCGA